jgi:hypothetical protein
MAIDKQLVVDPVDKIAGHAGIPSLRPRNQHLQAHAGGNLPWAGRRRPGAAILMLAKKHFGQRRARIGFRMTASPSLRIATVRAAKRNSLGMRTAREWPLWNTVVVFMVYGTGANRSRAFVTHRQSELSRTPRLTAARSMSMLMRHPGRPALGVSC